MTNPSTLRVLNDLIKTSKDGENGFRSAAEHAQAPALRNLLSRHADECAQAAQQLQQAVSNLGGQADAGGSVAGAVHRGWVAVRSALSGHTDEAILQECERGEDTALDRYEDALRETALPPDVRELVERQRQGVRRNHDEIRALRDQNAVQPH